MNRRSIGVIAAVAAVALVALAGCSSSGASGDKTIKIAYQKFGNFTQMDSQMKSVKKQYEKLHPGVTVDLIPIQADENDYYTKLTLMNKSASTAPDVSYEDTFLIKSDVQAGYLLPLDSYLSKWADWSKFYGNAKDAAKGDDGKTYGVSLGTDTRALWYNKELFAKAGLPVPWAPKTWDDVLAAAKTIKDKLPGVVPFNIYSGKAGGEASTMQGFEMLLYGTKDQLTDSSGKWVTGSKGFTDSLQFVKDVYQGGLGPTPAQALDPQVGNTIATQWIPQSKLAIDLDGSWLEGNWLSTGAAPWPQWKDTIGETPMPTQNGQAPGSTSMSGGWTLAIGSKSKNPDLAWDFVSLALNKANSQAYAIAGGQIAVRSDVAEDADYLTSASAPELFTKIVDVTHFRPATSVYPQISNAITVAMEAVMTGQQTPAQAAAAYDSSITQIAGADKVAKG